MKLEYQANELRRGDKWHCNFCPFERESLTATYKIVQSGFFPNLEFPNM